ncbi:MAG TPA: hypothetical protein VMB73_13790 [Acetobacteraceae bacterium]|nr:hypothetical protein [Acetobacteraceae bacterium]
MKIRMRFCEHPNQQIPLGGSPIDQAYANAPATRAAGWQGNRPACWLNVGCHRPPPGYAQAKIKKSLMPCQVFDKWWANLAIALKFFIKFISCPV